MLVVPAQRYILRQRSERGYELLPDAVWLVVDGLIRLQSLAFSASQSGPQERALRQTATGPAAASRAKGSGLSFLSEDTHNAILEASGANAAEGGEHPLQKAPAKAPPKAPASGSTHLSLQITIPQNYRAGAAIKCKVPIFGTFSVVAPPGAVPGETVRVMVRKADATSVP